MNIIVYSENASAEKPRLSFDGGFMRYSLKSFHNNKARFLNELHIIA